MSAPESHDAATLHVGEHRVVVVGARLRELDGHEIGHGHVALEDAYVAPAPDVRDVPGELSLRLGYLDLLHMTR
jgi:hypothetical protein